MNEQHKYPYPLCDLALGSFDLIDFIIRFRLKGNTPKEVTYQLLAHELFHYIQIVTTRVGFGHLMTVNDLLAQLYTLITQTNYPQPYMQHFYPAYRQGDNAVFNRIHELLSQLSSVWHFTGADDLPIIEEPIYLTKERAIYLDPDDSCIRVRGATCLKVGLHLVCETMARSADYLTRFFMNMESRNLWGKSSRPISWAASEEELNEEDPEFGFSNAEVKRWSVPEAFTSVGVLYDLPYLYAAQEGWKFPGNSGPVYATLCAWILLFDEYWIPETSIGALPERIGARYLAMLKHGQEVAESIYFENFRNNPEANAIHCADIICSHFKLKPFSQSLTEHINMLKEMLNLGLSSPHPNNGMYLWFVQDGLEILRILKEKPVRFFFPLPSYKSRGGGVINLPRPPIKYVDSWNITERVEPRMSHHVERAVLKESLFSSHNFEVPEMGVDELINSCVFNSDCYLAIEGVKPMLKRLISDWKRERKRNGLSEQC